MDEIALSGVSARIAKCKNLDEFTKALLNGYDLITDDHKRWNCDFLKTPKSIGVLTSLENFDARFFGINFKQAEQLDPRTRQLLEVVFESIVDAGYNPQDLRGTNTAVILAVSENSNEGLMDRSLAIMANTISYYLDLKGASYALDTGCSSSVYALNQAVEALTFESCEHVVVCSAQTHLLPTDSVQLNKLGVLSKEGRCKTFDDDRDGYVKSEGVISIFLQRQQNARRIYATIAGIGCNVDGFKEEGMSNPSSQSQLNLLNRIYERFQLDPNDVEYVDAHGTGTLIGDIKECAALAEFFSTKERCLPLKIGSVKTNAGHCENAAGLVSLVKLIIAINTGIITANLHFKRAAMDIPSVDDKKLEILQENTQYNGGLLSLNSFGIGGANGHVVIRPYLKPPSFSMDTEKPRIILVSGRSVVAVNNLLNKIEENKENLAFQTLLDNIFQTPIKNHNFKGFTLLNKSKSELHKCNVRKPIWFTYSGMGSQWPGMAKHLMHFKIFRDTVERCSNILKPYGIDLMEVVLNGNNDAFEHPEKCFPAIIVVSVGLTDVLYSLGIRPDGIIGHSLGEIGCAYADGLITSEQAILMAHARGLATTQTKLIPGLMASVGLTIQECEQILPEDIEVACHNSDQNVTISGPKNSVELFVEHLETKGIFVRIVNTAGIAFHSKYVHDAGVILLEMFRKILPEPKRRSEKWLPTAISESDYESYLGKFNSAEYHCQNFTSRVLYKQVLDQVPENAVLLEIAPSGLFQAIFRRALSDSILKLSFANKDIKDNVEFFLTTIGKIYLSTNISLNLNAINDALPLPLDGKTPFVSPLIQWDHSSKWPVSKYVPKTCHGEKIVLNLRSMKYKFLYGHSINGSAVFPSSGFLFLAWKAFANKHEKEINQCSVVLQNVHFKKSVTLKDILEFYVNILETGDFEILENKCLVAEGNISRLNESLRQTPDVCRHSEQQLTSEDIYKEFLLRGYDYSASFKGIQYLGVSGRSGDIKWHKNWITFIDAMMQSVVLYNYSTLVVPTDLPQMKIDPSEHQRLVIQNKGILKYCYDKVSKTAACGGVEIKGLISTQIKQRLETQSLILNQYELIPNELTYQGTHNSHFEFSLSIAIQIVMENNTKNLKTSIAELETEENKLRDIIFNLITRRYLKNIKYSLVKALSEVRSNINLLICPLQEDPLSILRLIEYQTFVFGKMKNYDLNNLDLDNIVFKCSLGEISYVLLRNFREISEKFEVVKTSTKDFMWVEKVKGNLERVDHKIYLISDSLTTGLVGFFNCLREELQAHNLRIFIFNNAIAEEFNRNSEFLRRQVQKDLTINIFENNSWSTYRTLPLKHDLQEKIESCDLTTKGEKEHLMDSSSDKTNLVSVLYDCLNYWNIFKYQQNPNKASYPDMGFSEISRLEPNNIDVSKNGHLRSNVEPNLCWKIPDNVTVSLTEAAITPFHYTMAYYALYIKGKIKKTTNILIYGTNPTCLAAVYFSLEMGCQVFIQLDNPNEISKVEKFYRENSQLHFVISNVPYCPSEIKLKTNCGGINAIFFSNEENIDKAHIDILGRDSTFIYIHQRNTEIDSYILNDLTLNNCQIFRIHVNEILTEVENIRSLMNTFIEEILNKSKGNLNLGIEKYCIQSKNIAQKLYFDCEKSYLVVGGLGGVGLELTKWLIKNGATKIILNSRSTTLSAYARFLKAKWLSEDITLLINNSDATTIEGATTLLEEATCIAPIDGIFNLAMVLKDKLITDLTPEDFIQVVAPKLHISEHLDQLSQKLCPDLQYFVVFSAMTVLGNPGQSNYAFANSAIEMLCKERRSRCLPALAVQWGCIGDVGYVSRQKIKDKLLRESPQSIHSCLETLKILLVQEIDVVSSAVYVSTDVIDNAMARESSKGNVLDHLALILGAASKDDLEKDVPLVNLGIDSITLLEIKSEIQNECGIEIPTCKIRKMTLEQIERMETKSVS